MQVPHEVSHEESHEIPHEMKKIRQVSYAIYPRFFIKYPSSTYHQ